MLEAAGLIKVRRQGRYKFHDLDTTPLDEIVERWPIRERRPMRINVTSVLVDDQQKALAFYTGTPGFVKKTEIPLGEAFWLTVASPEEPEGTELLLEPDDHPAARPYKQALVDDAIPYTSFAVDQVREEYERLKSLGVVFTREQLEMGGVTTAVFDDTCGNLIQLASMGQPVSSPPDR